MIYTPMTKKALKLCFEAHKDQIDKSGMPFLSKGLRKIGKFIRNPWRAIAPAI